MGFYHFRRLCPAFYDIRIDCPLCQEINSFQFPRFFFKDTDKFRADDLSLLLRIRYPRQFSEETL